jgi:hypothetical protein
MGAGCDLGMSEDGNAVLGYPGMYLGGVLISELGVLEYLPGMLLPGQVILFAVLLGGGAMGMRRAIVQLGGSLMIFVMRSVVIACRHN